MISRTLAFYILLITLIIVNVYYVTDPLIIALDIIIIAVISYLYMKLVNDVINLK